MPSVLPRDGALTYAPDARPVTDAPYTGQVDVYAPATVLTVDDATYAYSGRFRTDADAVAGYVEAGVTDRDAPDFADAVTAVQTAVGPVLDQDDDTVTVRDDPAAVIADVLDGYGPVAADVAAATRDQDRTAVAIGALESAETDATTPDDRMKRLLAATGDTASAYTRSSPLALRTGLGTAREHVEDHLQDDLRAALLEHAAGPELDDLVTDYLSQATARDSASTGQTRRTPFDSTTTRMEAYIDRTLPSPRQVATDIGDTAAPLTDPAFRRSLTRKHWHTLHHTIDTAAYVDSDGDGRHGWRDALAAYGYDPAVAEAVIDVHAASVLADRAND